MSLLHTIRREIEVHLRLHRSQSMSKMGLLAFTACGGGRKTIE